MGKLILIFSAIALAFASCESPGYKIEGTFVQDTHEGKAIYLYWMNLDSLYAKGPVLLDSAVVKDGAYQFRGQVAESPAMGVLTSERFENAQQGRIGNFVMVPVILEQNHISRITIDSSAVVASGTGINAEFDNVHSLTNQLMSTMHSVRSYYGTDEALLTEDQKDKIEEMDRLQRELQTATFEFIKANISNPAGKYMFVDSGNMLEKNQILELLSLCDSVFVANDPTLAVQKNYLAYQSMLNEKFVGKSIVGAGLQSMGGKRVNLSDYTGKNKVVLIDFWASWCNPCLAEIPHLKNAYNAYKDSGFEIVGISIDETAEAAQAAIDAFDLDWIQLHDAEQEASVTYGVESIPFSLLVDRDGIITNVNLRGKELKSALEVFFNK